jgi:hypothetical protein
MPMPNAAGEQPSSSVDHGETSMEDENDTQATEQSQTEQSQTEQSQTEELAEVDDDREDTNHSVKKKMTRTEEWVTQHGRKTSAESTRFL